MHIFNISFAGSLVSVHCNSRDARDYLSFLFPGERKDYETGETRHHLSLLYEKEDAEYTLHDGSSRLYHGHLGVHCATILYDSVIFHLINKAATGIALHAGGVAHRGKVILLPGQSGAGKSTLTAHLISRGCSYLTDELIYISNDESRDVQYLSRPVCLKPGSFQVIKEILDSDHRTNVLQDEYGAMIPHELINPQSDMVSLSPTLIIFPEYTHGAALEIVPISRAQLCTLLMACHVNARNLENHGFHQVLNIARSTPAFRIKYDNFQGIMTKLDDLIDVA